jgi:hypothetical protein
VAGVGSWGWDLPSPQGTLRAGLSSRTDGSWFPGILRARPRQGPSRPSPRPTPPLPLTSHDVQGEGHQEAEPGTREPPGVRCRAPSHPGAHPPH